MGKRSYDEAIAALQAALKFGINPSLDGITQLCEALGGPQDAFAVVQVGGTNGKTSTARYTQALLHAEGLHTGLYTSPELERYPERIELDGHVVSDDEFAEAVSSALDAAELLRPGADGTSAGYTEFELTTAAALWLFRERSVDIAVLEVGLGGRWDATSVTSPSVSVITGVGLDHVAILGDTLEAIAAEKAEIIRSGSTAVLGSGTAAVEDVFVSKARSVGAHVWAVREEDAPSPVAGESTGRFVVLQGPSAPGASTVMDVRGIHARYESLEARGPRYQAPNVACAVLAAEAALGRSLRIDRARAAVSSLVVPGRFELVLDDPPVVIDASHNPQSAEVLAATVTHAWPDAAKRPHLLLGILADKDAEGIVRALAPVACGITATRSSSPRSLSAASLAEIVEAVTGDRPATAVSVEEGMRALRGSRSGLLVTGSITTAGEARAVARRMRGADR